MTEFQKNFIRRAIEAYNTQIIEDIFGYPDEIDEIPDWVHYEIVGLLRMTEGENDVQTST